jgi:hypothetical protein
LPSAKKKLILQILILVAAPIAFGFIFAIFIFPLLIRVTGAAKMSEPMAQGDEFALQSPILNTPNAFISTTSFTLSGFAEPNATITILVDGREFPIKEPLVVTSSGEFSTEISLPDEGEYQISAYSLDPATKQTSPASNAFSVTVDLTTPLLVLPDLKNNQEFVGRDHQNLTIAGSTEPRAKIYLNDRLFRADTKGQFNIYYELSEGDNVLNFSVEDEAGNQSQTQLTVKFKQ